MLNKGSKKYLGVMVLIVLLFALTGCDLYDSDSREGITMNNETNNGSKVDYLDGKDPEDKTDSHEEAQEENNTETTETTSLVEEVESTDQTSDTIEDNSDVDLEEGTVGNTALLEEDTDTSTVITEEEMALARDLNSEGYIFYQEGDYESALAKFKESMDKDKEYFFAHFNYACTLGVLMKENYEQWYEVKDEVIDELKICLELDPSSQRKIINDSDLDLVKTEFRYLTEVVGYDLTTSEGVRSVLEQSNWYIHGNGVISVLGQVDFNGNKVSFSYLNLEKFNEGTIGDAIVSIGRYSYDGSVITFTMDEATLKRRSLSDVYNNYNVLDDRVEFIGTLSSDGILTIDGFEYQFFTWYDEFSA